MRNRISELFSGDLLQHQNFEESQEAMKQQLLQLSILLKALDPELCDFLGESTVGDVHLLVLTRSCL